MQNISIVLNRADTEHNDAVSLFCENNKWSSPEGGWLSGNGYWANKPEGVVLFASDKVTVIANLNGLTVSTANEGNNGIAIYSDPTDVGRWRVVATSVC